MATSSPPCRLCAAGQRLSTLSFAIFAAALVMAAMDPDETPLRQAVLALCAALSGLAVFRFPIARLAGAMMTRPAPRRAATRTPTDE
jgi:hypothetical protein